LYVKALPKNSINTHQGWSFAFFGGVLGACLALVLMAPATWLGFWVDHASHGRLLLANTQGTVWQGSAQLVLSPFYKAPSTVALPAPIHWQIWPIAGPTGMGLSLQLRADCCTPKPVNMLWWAGLEGGRFVLEDQVSQWPLHLLTGLGAPWNTLQPKGWLVFKTDNALIHKGAKGWQFDGELVLKVSDVSVSLSTLNPLGTYQLKLRGGETAQLTLSTLGGALQLSGRGELHQMRLTFSGQAGAAPTYEAALSNLLNLIGQRQGSKAYFNIG
jgi:general secretion pathway protein N